MNDTREEIGKRIRTAREKAGKSQEEVAFDSGLSACTLSKIECGKSDVKLSSFIRIIQSLNVSPNNILLAEVENTKVIYEGKLHELIKDCSANETATVLAIVEKCMRLKDKKG